MALSSKTTIAKNTVLLYIRTLIVLFISLWTSRVILHSLGVEDFGIFNAVGGLVTMFSILTGSMSHAISRFITFELGTGDFDKLKRVFSASLIVQLSFIAVIILIAETLGIWFLNNKMTIPHDRIAASNWVFQFTLVTFCFSLMSIPYNAEVIAHEHLKTYAYVGVIEYVLRLVIAYAIYVSPMDRLIFYSLLMMFLAIGVRVFYQLYCRLKFEECTNIVWKADKKLIWEMGKFAGWNMFGTAAITFRTQGISIILNMVFGPLLNAAYGIANQVNSAVMSFINNFTTAFTPSITKSYAEKKYSYMISLVLQGTRFSYYLMLLFVLPLLLETDILLKLWIKDVPEYSVPFVRLVLILSLVEVMSQTVVKAVLATGNIKKYQIIIGSISLFTIPIAYWFLKLGYAPESTMVVAIVFALIALVVRLIIVKPIIGLSFYDFAKFDLVPIISVTLVSVVLPIVAYISLPIRLFYSFFIVCATSVISVALSALFVGCSKTERKSLISKARAYISKV